MHYIDEKMIKEASTCLLHAIKANLLVPKSNKTLVVLALRPSYYTCSHF